MLPVSTAAGIIKRAAITLTGIIKRRKKETIITETARNSKQKAAIVRNNLNGRMKTARNSQKTATEGKETTAREITITTTGTEDKTRDGTTKTDVRKEDQIKNVHKDRNGRIRNVRNNKTVNGNSKGRNVKNATKGRARRNPPPSVSELNALLRVAAPHIQRVILLGIYTGARIGPSELFSLKWDDVDLTRSVIGIRLVGQILNARHGRESQLKTKPLPGSI